MLKVNLKNKIHKGIMKKITVKIIEPANYNREHQPDQTVP